MADSYFSSTSDSRIVEMRKAFEYAWNEGAANRRERAIDIRFLSGDQWPDADKRQRALPGAERPMLVLDELNQYTNLVVNTQMQSRLGIQINPEGDGSNDETARIEDTIRGIEYRSKAQLAYISGFEGAVWGGFGAWKVTREYKRGSFDQELYIRPIYNTDTCIIDGDSVEVDGSDMKCAWIINRMGRGDFSRKYGSKARVVDFTPEQVVAAPQWIGEDNIQIAEYWEKTMRREKLLGLQYMTGETAEAYEKVVLDMGLMFSGNEFYNPQTGELIGRITQARWDEVPMVKSCITNGIEILEETSWPGQWIPIIPCYGKILWVDKGSGPKRELQSLIRNARDPQMALNYCKTAIVETIGRMPMGGVIGYEGQFENHEDEWSQSYKIPKSYLQVKATIEDAPGVVLPLPTNRQFGADIAAAQSAAEDFRRSIQAAVGQNALPSSAQQRNEKSGVALSRIAEAQAIGSYHLVQHFQASVEMTGRIIEDLLPAVYDTDRTIGIRKKDETYQMVKVSAEMFKARHSTTVSTGPSSQSQREEVQKVASELMANPEYGQRVGWLAIKLMNLGPIGDQISDLLKPADIQSAEGMSPQQIMAQAQQQQQQLQQAQLLIDDLSKELAKTKGELEARRFEQETKLAIAEKQDATERWKAQLEAQTKLALPAVQHKLKIEEIEVQGDVDKELTEEEGEQARETAETQADLMPEPKESEQE